MFGKTNDMYDETEFAPNASSIYGEERIFMILYPTDENDINMKTSDLLHRPKPKSKPKVTSTQAEIKTQSKDSRTKASFYFASSTIREGRKVVTLANSSTAFIRLPGFAIFSIVSFAKISGQIRTSAS